MHRYASHFARTLTFVLLVGAAVTQSMAQYLAPQTDVPNSKDNPIVSRFAGSTIIGYQEVDYDEVALSMGPCDGSEFAKTLETKRKVTRIAYAAPSGKRPVEVFTNFRDSLQQGGFRLLYSGTAGRGSGTACGGFPFAEDYSEQMLEHDSAHGGDVITLLRSENDDVRYLLAELQRGTGKVDIGLMVSQNRDPPVGVLLQVVENGQMQSDEVTVDSAAITKGLQSEESSRCTVFNSRSIARICNRILTPH